MNEQGLIDRLRLLFAEFSEELIMCSEFQVELLRIISRSGQELQFLSTFRKYLLQLRENGEACIDGRGSPMEHLYKNAPLCSMRFLFSGSNIRILFALLDGKVYLLCAFYERAGHKNTEYGAHIPAASDRLANLREENENE